jgi:hypothetical protein
VEDLRKRFEGYIGKPKVEPVIPRDLSAGFPNPSGAELTTVKHVFSIDSPK